MILLFFLLLFEMLLLVLQHTVYLGAGYDVVIVVFPKIFIHMGGFFVIKPHSPSNLRALQILHNYLDISLYLVGFFVRSVCLTLSLLDRNSGILFLTL